MQMRILVGCLKKDLKQVLKDLKQVGFEHDEKWGPHDTNNETCVIRGAIDQKKIAAIRKIPGIFVFPDINQEPTE